MFIIYIYKQSFRSSFRKCSRKEWRSCALLSRYKWEKRSYCTTIVDDANFLFSNRYKFDKQKSLIIRSRNETETTIGTLPCSVLKKINFLFLSIFLTLFFQSIVHNLVPVQLDNIPLPHQSNQIVFFSLFLVFMFVFFFFSRWSVACQSVRRKKKSSWL